MSKSLIVIILLCAMYDLPIEARDAVTASLSTVGWREKSLKVVVDIILPQVDQLNVFLQHYKEVPSFLNHPKITVALGSDYPQVLSLGAGAKFFWADRVRGYHLTIDDDILYPHNYVDYCISKIEQYDRKAVVGMYGFLFKESVNSYLKDRIGYGYDCILLQDTPVHALGTGTLAYHTDTIRVSVNDMLARNMADISFAILGQKQKVPFIVLEKKHKYYLGFISGFGREEQAISSQVKQDDSMQTAFVQRYQPWQLHTTI